MNLYNISISLRKEGYQITVERIEADETKAAFKFPGKLIKKSLLNKIDSKFYNQLSLSLGWYCYSLEDDIEENKIRLKLKCEETLSKFEIDLQNLKTGISNELPIRIRDKY